MFNGIEIDMLSLGDADCIVVTHWTYFGPQRVLIDGGNAGDAESVKDFLKCRGFTSFWAVVCTHPHGDHAGGLVKLVQDNTFTIQTAWMHDLRKHMSADILRRASGGSSSQADGVKEVIENTRELASAFASRNIVLREPFSGVPIADFPPMIVLGPSFPFYRSTVQEFTKVQISAPILSVSLSSLLGQRTSPPPPSSGFAWIEAPYPSPGFPSLSSLLSAPPLRLPIRPANSTPLPSLIGALSESRVKKTPKTQPFNNTSAILGVLIDGQRLLFTSDAGDEALGRVPAEWNHLLWMQVPHHGSDANLSQQEAERFCPRFAYVSACGDASHPSRAVVSGLVKVGGNVFSTHKSGHLWFFSGSVPARTGYSPAIPLRGTGEPQPVFNRLRFLSGIGR